jgi:tetratricopeptide (TPR) repeat protein
MFVFVFFFFSSLQSPAKCQPYGKGEELGSITFPTSCAPTVQESFVEAVTLLHSFGYEEAERAFVEITRRDAQCGMAYWGIAMSVYHPLWDRPDATTLKKGEAALEKARSVKSSPRERDYIAALGSFYDAENSNYLARVIAYAKAMRTVYLRYPRDREASAFYALSLLGADLSQDNNFSYREQAATILERLFVEEPNHPGVAHYLVHAYDTPQLAARGLRPARHYAAMAPPFPHALHMPSHIFTRLGLWDESIQSNLASVAAARNVSEMHMGMASDELHAMDYLVYAYLQSGRETEAESIVEKTKNMPVLDTDKLGSGELAYALAEFPARCAIELRHWPDAASLVLSRNVNAITYWARAIGEARSGNIMGAHADWRQLDAISASLADHRQFVPMIEIYRLQAGSWLAHAEGNDKLSLRQMLSAVDLEDKKGLWGLAIPAREMLADLLFELGNPKQALAQYERSLRSAPNRFNGLFGAARAAELAGSVQKAAFYYSKLLKSCDGGTHSNRPEIRQAKAFLGLSRVGIGDGRTVGIFWRGAWSGKSRWYTFSRASHAKRTCRDLPRKVARRAFERELVSEPLRRAAEDRGVADRVRRRTFAQRSGISDG